MISTDVGPAISGEGKRQAHLKQWRQQCLPLNILVRRLARRHQLARQGDRMSRMCAIATHGLSKTLAHVAGGIHRGGAGPEVGKQTLPQ